VKVIGTGAPDALTIQFEACERELLLEELRHQRSTIIEDAGRAQQRAGRRADDQALEESHAHLLTLASVLQQVDDHPLTADSIEVRGPTWFLRDVIHGATAEAIERLTTIVTDFQQLGRPRPQPEDLQSAVRTAGAWVETLVGYCHADLDTFELIAPLWPARTGRRR
jgi:hypothetical protein